MTNDEAVREALETVAIHIDEVTTGRIAALRNDVEANRDAMPHYLFEIYEQIRRARIEGIEWAAQEAGKVIMRQETVLGVKR